MTQREGWIPTSHRPSSTLRDRNDYRVNEARPGLRTPPADGATGLPRLENGRFYQAWLRDSADVIVPIGTFNEGREVTLWAGVSPNDFRTLTVTREQADGDQASSGEKVLAGTVDPGDSG